MFFYVRDGWHKCTRKQKAFFLVGMLTFLAALVALSISLTILHENAVNNSTNQKLLRQIGTGYVSSVQCTEAQNVVTVEVSLKEASEQTKNTLYPFVYEAARNEVLTENQYQNVKKIVVSCVQGGKEVTVIQSEKGSDPKRKFSTYGVSFPEDTSRSMNGIIVS